MNKILIYDILTFVTNIKEEIWRNIYGFYL